MSNVFVTVGTTSFEALVNEVFTEACARVLREKHGVGSVTVQLGRSEHLPPAVTAADPRPLPPLESRKLRVHGLDYEVFRFRPWTRECIDRAAFVISHAGSGSIFDALRANRPLFVCVNEALMDNHQEELAAALAAGGHLVYSTPATLVAKLEHDFEPSRLLPLPPPTMGDFVRACDALVGIESTSSSSSSFSSSSSEAETLPSEEAGGGGRGGDKEDGGEERPPSPSSSLRRRGDRREG